MVNFTRKFKVTLGSKAEWNDSTLDLRLEKKELVEGPRTKLSILMGSFPSIFPAEVFAISRCVGINLQLNYRSESIAILSNSQAPLKAISAYEIKWLLVQECIERLSSLSERNQGAWSQGYSRG